MKIQFLGTGTSVGVPAIGCSCPVCVSGDPRNKRFRSSLYAEAGGVHLVVDTTPDFRSQALACGIPRVDALLFTHSHADHILGFDDIRRYNTIQKSMIPAYGSPDTVSDMNRIFDYIRAEHPPGVFRPDVEFREVTGPFEIGPWKIEPFVVPHGAKTTCGFRMEAEGRSLGYFPDCKEMRADVISRLGGLDVMILDCLRRRPHATHLSLSESLAALEKIAARRSYLVHMCHDLDHETTTRELPENVFLSHDTLSMEW